MDVLFSSYKYCSDQRFAVLYASSVKIEILTVISLFQVSNARPEDSKIRQEDFTKILASVQSVHSKQENIDARLAALKR